MTELDLPLRSPALYNPHLLSREELVALFSAREALLEELLTDLRGTPANESAQHHLIVGQRGMGKTMLLRRLQCAVDDDPSLREIWLPLSFPEEQYNVVTLSDFWLNCVDALSDILEARGGTSNSVEALDRAVEEIRGLPDEGHRAKRALDALLGTAESLGRRLLLLVDNADLILDRIGEQDWALREVLSSRPKVTFIGASAAMLESTYEYGRAFYDFFKVHELAGLSVEETKRFLLRYADAQENPRIREVVENEPARLRTLHTLTGGNPRTLVLLFNIFAHGPDGDVRSDLEQLLDQCTPLYKARFEALPAQAQQVVDALALHWDPVSAGELAETLRMKVNQVSAQLNRLTQIGVVEKVPYEPDSKTGFQIAERFFNIWYLMRASRRVRRRLVWLVEFLKIYYGQEALRGRIKIHLRAIKNLRPEERLRHAEYSFALASLFDEHEMRLALERTALQVLIGHKDLHQQLRNLVDLETPDTDLSSRAQYIQRFDALKKELDLLAEAKDSGLSAEFAKSLLQAPLDLETKEYILENLSEEREAFVINSIDVFFRVLGLEGAADPIHAALENEYMLTMDDFEGARIAEEALGTPGLTSIALAIKASLTHDGETWAQLEGALEEATSHFPFVVWFIRRGTARKNEYAEPHVDRLLNLPSPSHAWRIIIANHLTKNGSPDLGEKIARRTIDEIPSSHAYRELAFALARQNRWTEALATAKMFLNSDLEEVHQDFLSEVVSLFREWVLAGRTEEAATLLDELDLGERWRPLREALEAIARDSDTYLRRVAPEVREPAEAILKQLKEPIEAS